MWDKTEGNNTAKYGDTYQIAVDKYLYETKRIDYPTVYLEINDTVVYEDKGTPLDSLRLNE
jgi:hypothetical protein